MTLVDSVRWDTAAPKVMALPLNDNADSVVYCHVYEAFFDTPVVVHDTFYFVGTYHSNSIYRTYDTVFNNGEMYVSSTPHFRHFPTDYVVVWDNYEDRCVRCPVVERMFLGLPEIHEDWLETYNWQWLVSGPFLPIVISPAAEGSSRVKK